MGDQDSKKKDSHDELFFPIYSLFQERPLRNILESIDQFFHQTNLKPGFKVRLFEDAEKYTVRAELPGVGKNQIDLRIMEHSVTITVDTRKTETVEDKKEKTVSQSHYRKKVSRTIPLYHPVKVQRSKAKYCDGLLTVHLLKKYGKRIPLDD